MLLFRCNLKLTSNQANLFNKRKTKISFLRILFRGSDKNLKEFEYLLQLLCERNKVMAW